MVAAVLILGLWWLVAHNGGSGWVQVLGDIVFGALCIGILGPSLILARAKVRVVASPTDGTAGLPVELHLECSTRLRVSPVEPPGDVSFVGPRRDPGAGQITLRPSRRGVFDSLTLDVASAAPFGLQWWRRRVRVPLPSALHVAPRRGRPDAPSLRRFEQAGDAAEQPHRSDGYPRGTRPYRRGDNRRLVHWRATAHAGELMVRELERPSSQPPTVTVALPSNPDEAERVAERALGTVTFLLERGNQVVLTTTEASGSVMAPVVDRRAAGRRLARALARPGVQPAAGGVTVTR
jgi:uncharacterized protein (DUF58 family)